MAFAYLKHFYGCSEEEICNMSMYKIHKYIEHIPAVLGQKKEEPDERDKQYMNQTIPETKIDDNYELIKQAKELGLKVPRHY